MHVVAVSERFNGTDGQAKQEEIRWILRERLDADSGAISLALAYGTDDQG
ncbi:MAG TPA: hypothetical protein VFJ58_02210 [Armatimonadota bacterium]|nr:hypothetical protein [Armatimonadota bacterium]